MASKISAPGVCVCGERTDEWGRHALECRLLVARHVRHAALNHILQQSLREAGLQSRLEPVGLTPKDGKRSEGATLIPWEYGWILV